MSITVQATQLSNETVEIGWTTDLSPASGWQIWRQDDGGSNVLIGQQALATDRGYVDLTPPAAGVVATYEVTDSPFTETGTAVLSIADLDVPFTYAPPRPDASAPRYTSLETLKRRLRIPSGNGDYDEDLTEAIVAAEIALDYELGQSFPSTGDNPQYPEIPTTVVMLSTSAAIAVYKAADAPFGKAGSDEWFGSLSVADVASQTIRRSPLIRGLQRSFGVG